MRRKSREQLIKFTITLSSDEWNKIYQEERHLYKRSDRENSFRAYDVLTSNEWSSLIHEHFFDHTKKACPMVYKTAKICPTGNIFLNIKGHCSVQ